VRPRVFLNSFHFPNLCSRIQNYSQTTDLGVGEP
jgi:hypothetical protein